MAETEQLAVSYASFILSSQGAAITPESINAVLKAANVSASSGLVNAVAKGFKGRSVNDFIGGIGAAGSEPAPAEQKPSKGKAESKPAK